MSQMTPGQTRVVDPILSNVVRGYKRPGNVARVLFPIVYVTTYGGKTVEFGKESFRLHNSARAPGSNTKRIDVGYAGKPFAITPHALEAKVPRELMRDASQVPGIDLAGRATNVAMDSLELEHEYESAQLARSAANYDAEHKTALVGPARWTSATSDPSADIAAALEAIRGSIGIRGNRVVLGPSAFAAARVHPKIIERIKYTSRDSATPEILASLWQVKEVVVGDAVVATGANDDFGDVWGDDAIVAYVPDQVEAGNNQFEPSYGYTYAIDGEPSVETPYYDNNAKSWIYGVSNDSTPVQSGMVAGYLIQDAGKPAA